jgi:serine/threonine protein phosphatase PrpC
VVLSEFITNDSNPKRIKRILIPTPPQAKAAREANNTIPHPVALAVARSLGDRHFKIPNLLLSAEPDMEVRKVTNGSGLMLSCDGVFDVMRNEEVRMGFRGEEE